ncbi:TonB-dependent receptor [Parapedobacter tibetensis]|uniref:TonB-dependent receptor n=1 Tax=Parapedobacter tibetensis TaxID=2972951 RepID=UPI00214D6E04|nr:TonB-dependent receptor [Parapedobacter tibetensis]
MKYGFQFKEIGYVYLMLLPITAGKQLSRHIVLPMKLTVLLIVLFSFKVSADAYSQGITHSFRNASLQDVIVELSRQTEYDFVIHKQHVAQAKPITINLKDAEITSALDRILSGQPFTYEIFEHTIIIRPRKTQMASIASKPQQPFSVRGHVTDSLGNPLSGVTVKVKETVSARQKRGTTTDANGIFTIEVDSNAILIFSAIGHETSEIPVNSRREVKVVLKEAISEMGQVVVIGYGSVRRKDLTGSVGQAKVEEMQKAPIISFEEALAGRVAGVKVSSADGQPGAPINIVIRGTNSVTQDNSPLYVIDGFPMENPDNYTLNPSEIESIEILKDASSTAIYGARGANGVVIITTKKGKIGAPVISYNMYYGFLKNKRKMELMNAHEFVQYQMERDSANAAETYLINGKMLEDFRNAPSIDLQDQVFRTSPFQNHFMSINGGQGGTRYSISGSILGQDGVIKNSGYDRYQGRVTLDQAIGTKLKVGVNANYTAAERFGTVPSEQRTGFFYGNLLYSVWAYRPASGQVVEDPLEQTDEDFLNLMGFNPIQTVENEYRANKTDLLTTNVFGEYSFGKYVKLRASGGVTKSKVKRESFNNSLTPLGSPLTTSGQNNGVNGSVTYSELTSLLNENTLSFNKTFNQHHKLDAVAGFTVQKTRTFSYGASANHIPNESLGIAGISEGEPVRINSGSSQHTLASFLGRVNYAYRAKYLFTASIRADGSSKFSPGNKWGYFPSGAVAWRLGSENFMQGLTFISDAKIRLSYGVTGNNRVLDFAYLSRIDLPSSIGYSYNNTPVKAAILSELGNINLQWESTDQLNLGLDLGLFDERITLTTDAYRKTTTDLLLNARLPNSMGFTTGVKNIGSVENRGLEFTLNAQILNNEAFSWNSNFNIAFNRNKVLALTENQQTMLTLATWNIDLRNVPPYIAEVGYPIARFYGYIWEGNYQYEDFNETAPGTYVLKDHIATYNANRTLTQPGDIKYKDVNGDGVVNTADRTNIGDPNPNYIGGFSNDLTYKNFDLNIFFEFSAGNDVLNANRIIFEGGGRVNQNMYATYLNRWTPENQNDLYYRTNGRGPSDFGYSTRIIEDGSYLRLKTIALGYTLPASITRKVKMNTVRVYASAQNIYTWTKYQGFDPEVSAYGSNALMPAFDYSVYPRAFTITFGANISF